MTEPFIGEIKLVGFNFAPRGYFLCDGNYLTVADNTALFSLLGTQFGGDGRTNFGLPDLRGRFPVCCGDGRGVPYVLWGQRGGIDSTTLDLADMPAHTHALGAYSQPGNATSPENAVLAASTGGQFSGTAASGIPVSGSTTIQGKTGALQNGQTSEDITVSGTVTAAPYSSKAPTVEMRSDSISTAGNGMRLNLQSPFLAMQFVIAATGIYPPRN